MKKLFLLSIAATFICSISFAKVWRVNNNLGINAIFKTAQQAHDSSAVIAGDTLYFEHSVSSYGGLIMTKGLKLIGAGYFLPQNLGLQYNLNATFLDNIMIRPTATNTTISVSCLNITDSANNVTIKRCEINGNIAFIAANNCTVTNCYVLGNLAFNAISRIPPQTCGIFGCTGMSIYNNIIVGTLEQDALAFWGPTYSGCHGATWLKPHSVSAFNNSIGFHARISGSFYNNVCSFIYTDAGSGITNNIFNSPISVSRREIFLPAAVVNLVQLETGNANQFNIGPTTIYMSLLSNSDTSARLKPLSPAIGAGIGGTDCGATGGVNPYVFGLIPAIPTIYKLNVAPATNGNSIGVTISTKSNN
jgi:hypothetical protein